MLPVCILLTVLVAVFPVNNGLTPKCDVTCRYFSFIFGDDSVECLIQTTQTSNCTFDVSELSTSNFKSHRHIFGLVYLIVELVCNNTQYRPIFTNEQNLSLPNGYVFLDVKKCGLLWQDLDTFGKWLPLRHLYLEDWKDRWDDEIVETEYWKRHLDLRGENESGITDSQKGPVIIPQGLREVKGVIIVNIDHMPGISDVFIWPKIYELFPLTNTQLFSQFKHSHLQTIFPRLQYLLITNCSLPHTFKHVLTIGIVADFIHRRFVKLDENKITDLSNCTFKGSLEHFGWTYKNLSMLNANLFVNMLGLRTIGLNSNNLRSILPGLFRNQVELTHIYLGENLLENIPEGLFQCLSTLEYVDLSDNSLTNIPSGLFRRLPSLKKVDLSHNSITGIPESLFKNLPSLKKVDLSANMLTVMNNRIFEKLPAIEEINLAANELKYIADDVISRKLRSLKLIDLSKNQLTAIPTFIFLLRRLEMTNLSRNCITFESIKENFENTSEKQLMRIHKRYMVNNQPVSPKSLILSSNTISTIDIDSLVNNSVLLVSLLFHYFEVVLHDNNLVCDCKVYSFYNHMHDRGKPSTTWNVHSYNKNYLRCGKPDHLHGKLLYSLESSDFFCTENFHCPQHCTCSRWSTNKTITVSCKQVNMSAFPTQLPLGSRELDLSHNLIAKFDSTYPYLAKLEKLNLQNNLINFISADVLNILNKGHIRELQLNKNRLRNLPLKADVFMGTNLSHLTLSNNSWECNCHTSWMREWLIMRRDIIQDVEEVMCVSGIAAGQLYMDFIDDQFDCTTPAATVVRNEYMLLYVGAVLVSCGIVIILIYVFRGKVKILLYLHCNWHPFDSTENADIIDMQYDAFISYSGLDYKWVCFDLLPKLENHSPPYRVCVHDRDFMPGAYIEDNIMEAVQSSRRMILVLSQNYLKSDWCMLEFRAAHNKVLNDRTNYLILVLYDDVNVSELDEDMKLYIRTNTYLVRSNKWFYEKLLYAMPKKGLQQLRTEMEIKKIPSNHPQDFTTGGQQASSSSQLSSNTDTLMTSVL